MKNSKKWFLTKICYIPHQASNFGCAFDQLFLWIFFWNLQMMPLSVFYIMVQKSKKWPKTQSKGSCLKKSLVSCKLTSTARAPSTSRIRKPKSKGFSLKVWNLLLSLIAVLAFLNLRHKTYAIPEFRLFYYFGLDSAEPGEVAFTCNRCDWRGWGWRIAWGRVSCCLSLCDDQGECWLDGWGWQKEILPN